jgi:hypothetical protein
MWEVIPIHSFPIRGFACVPIGYDDAQTLFLWLVFFPLVASIPSASCLFIAWKVWRNDLLHVKKRNNTWVLTPDSKDNTAHPESGVRGRDLAFHFARSFFLVFALWLPATLLFFGDALESHWGFFVGGILGHLQGLASALFSLRQPDIRQAAMDLLCCCVSKTSVRVTPQPMAGVKQFAKPPTTA